MRWTLLLKALNYLAYFNKGVNHAYVKLTAVTSLGLKMFLHRQWLQYCLWHSQSQFSYNKGK